MDKRDEVLAGYEERKERYHALDALLYDAWYDLYEAVKYGENVDYRFVSALYLLQEALDKIIAGEADLPRQMGSPCAGMFE